MYDVFYEEFKLTGKAEIHLSRQMAQRRLFPAIDFRQSSTRKEELLLDKETLEVMWKIRESISHKPLEESEQLLRLVRNTKTNQEFVDRMKKSFASKMK